jgi:hypothetical protein
VTKFDPNGPMSNAELLANHLRANERTIDRDSIERSLRSLGLVLVDRKSWDDYSWTVNPDRMGS